MLDARRFKTDRTPNDPSACVERLRKDAPAKLQHCPGFKGTDNAKHPAAGTNQHAAALVVDISVVNFRLDPRLSEKDALGFIDLCNAGLGSERLGIGSSSRVSRQEKKHGRVMS